MGGAEAGGGARAEAAAGAAAEAAAETMEQYRSVFIFLYLRCLDLFYPRNGAVFLFCMCFSSSHAAALPWTESLEVGLEL
jgi:hypothetical protein